MLVFLSPSSTPTQTARLELPLSPHSTRLLEDHQIERTLLEGGIARTCRAAPMDYFQTLPPEIVIHIFGFLPAETLMCAVSLVSKTFRDYAYCDTLWTTVRYNYRLETAARFQNFLRKQGRVQDLTLEIKNLFFNVCCPDFIFPELSSLTKLVLRSSPYYNFIILNNNYPNLKELELFNLYLCRSIDTGQCNNERISVLEHVCRKFKKLEKLTIEDKFYADGTEEMQRAIWYHLDIFHLDILGGNLKELKIRKQCLYYSEVKKITESCTRLQTFHFETVCYIHDISDLLGHLPLRDLALTTTTPCQMNGPEPTQNMTCRSMCKLFQRLPDLVRCSFNAAFDQIDNRVLEYLTMHCKKLEVIKLTNLPSVTDVGIMCLVNGLKNLKELHVLNCVNCDKDKVVAHLSSDRNFRFF